MSNQCVSCGKTNSCPGPRYVGSACYSARRQREGAPVVARVRTGMTVEELRAELDRHPTRVVYDQDWLECECGSAHRPGQTCPWDNHLTSDEYEVLADTLADLRSGELDKPRLPAPAPDEVQISVAGIPVTGFVDDEYVSIGVDLDEEDTQDQRARLPGTLVPTEVSCRIELPTQTEMSRRFAAVTGIPEKYLGLVPICPACGQTAHSNVRCRTCVT